MVSLSLKNILIAVYVFSCGILLSKYAWQLATVSSKSPSRASLRFKHYCVGVCSSLFQHFKERDDKAASLLTEWSKKFNDKKEKWARKSEKLPQQVQRAQRNARRNSVYIPFVPFGVNVEAVGRVAKIFNSLCVVCLLPFAGAFNGLLLPSYWLGLATCLAYASMHISFTKIPLRNSQWWWYRPWPLIWHAYRQGHFPFKEYHYFLLLYFGLPLSLVLLLWTCHIGWWKLRQLFVTYFVYYTSKRLNLKFWAYVTTCCAPYGWIASTVGGVVETTISTTYNLVKRALYAIWVFCTPFLNERRRKGLRVYWTFW